MSTSFDDIEKQARSLPLKEKAALARLLIEDLDTSVDYDVERYGSKKRDDGTMHI